MNRNIKWLLLGAMILAGGCKKFVELAPPSTSVTKDDVYSSDSKAAAVVSYIYYNMTTSNVFAEGGNGNGLLGALTSDEMRTYSTNYDVLPIYQNQIQTSNGIVLNYWTNAYANMYRANLALENITASAAISDSVKTQMQGELHFVRAFINFYLVNCFGDIPLLKTSDYNVSSVASRTASADVYQAIVEDLQAAQQLLSNNYYTAGHVATSNRLRPNKAAATALLAKVYLYMGKWQDAETQATSVITNSQYMLEPNLDDVFKQTSRESIWSLRQSATPYYTMEGNAYILTNSPVVYANSTSWNNVITDSLLQAFEQNDLRRQKWIGSYSDGTSTWYFPYKYKSSSFTQTVPEDFIALRLAELYLVRAEARAGQKKYAGTDGAAGDLNMIRQRAGLGPVTASDAAGVQQAIEQERRIELMAEGGNRWFDLKRWKGIHNPSITRLDEVMPSHDTEKGNTWVSTAALWPVPRNERINDPNLTQNPGYGF